MRSARETSCPSDRGTHPTTTEAIPRHKHVGVGYCSVCCHYGEDCIGYKHERRTNMGGNNTLRVWREGARYGVQHLMAINQDVQTEESYSKKMQQDMNQAIVLLQAAPAAIDALTALLGFVEAGPIEPSLRSAVRRANDAIQLVLSPDGANIIRDVL